MSKCYPSGMGINSVGENSNFAYHELIVKSGNQKLLYCYSSGSPPFMFSINHTANVVPIKTFQKNILAIKAHMQWMKVGEGKSHVLCLYHPKNEFELFIPLLDDPELTNVPGVELLKFDYTNCSKYKIMEDFETTDFMKLVGKLMEEHGCTEVTSEGLETVFTTQNGKLHFSIASNRRLPFFPHAAILFTMIRKLDNFKRIKSADFPMADVLTLLGNHLIRLMDAYDRGRAKLITRNGNWMIDELKIPSVSDDKNEDINLAIQICEMSTGFNHKKKEEIENRDLGQDVLIDGKIKILILSWNVSGYVPESRDSLEGLVSRLRKMEPSELPDLIIIGLQEVVELKAKNITQFVQGGKERVTSNSHSRINGIIVLMSFLSRLGSMNSLLARRWLA